MVWTTRIDVLLNRDKDVSSVLVGSNERDPWGENFVWVDLVGKYHQITYYGRVEYKDVEPKEHAVSAASLVEAAGRGRADEY